METGGFSFSVLIEKEGLKRKKPKLIILMMARRLGSINRLIGKYGNSN